MFLITQIFLLDP